LKDYVQAKNYIEQYLSTAPKEDILPDHYTLGINILSKFPGTEATIIGYIEKGINSDTVKQNKINLADKAADLMEKNKNYQEELKWLKFSDSLKGTMGEYEYYKLDMTALNAQDYQQTYDIADKYITAFPDKPQGYSFKTRAAHAIDTSNTTGLYFDAISQQNTFLEKDTAANKQTLINNYYVQIGYYNDALKDYQKALDACDKVLALVPNEPQTLQIRQAIEKNMKAAGSSKGQDSTAPAKPKSK
jgi:tetratricopeptide (TPR) repeat protein